ncbi:MAG: hypothetical protein E7517_05325 [Ruminococcaceae bacterium]|nr:hypothetical protein [Oscillospiraceae bacterium]
MDEKKNESVLPEDITETEEIVEAPDVTAVDENTADTAAPEAQQEQPAEEADNQETVEAGEPEKAAEEAAVASETIKKPLSTQKLLSIIAASVLAVAFIVGGVVLAKNVHDNKVKNTLKDGSPTSEVAKEANNKEAEVVTGKDSTKGAEVADSDAIAVISELSNAQLGIEKDAYTDKKDKEHSFMVAGQSYVIDGEKYVQVIAAEKKENKDKSFSITPQAKFYISFDGKTILKEDMENPGTYEKIK